VLFNIAGGIQDAPDMERAIGRSQNTAKEKAA
jgi:hypothetical protein